MTNFVWMLKTFDSINLFSSRPTVYEVFLRLCKSATYEKNQGLAHDTAMMLVDGKKVEEAILEKKEIIDNHFYNTTL